MRKLIPLIAVALLAACSNTATVQKPKTPQQQAYDVQTLVSSDAAHAQAYAAQPLFGTAACTGLGDVTQCARADTLRRIKPALEQATDAATALNGVAAALNPSDAALNAALDEARTAQGALHGLTAQLPPVQKLAAAKSLLKVAENAALIAAKWHTGGGAPSPTDWSNLLASVTGAAAAVNATVAALPPGG